MNGGIERACGDQGTQLRDWLVQVHLLRDFGSGFQVFRLEHDIDVDRMTGFCIALADLLDPPGEALHRFEGGVVGKCFRRK